MIWKSLTPKQEVKYEILQSGARRGRIEIDGLRLEATASGMKCCISRVFQFNFNSPLMPEHVTQSTFGPRLLRATVDEYCLLESDPLEERDNISEASTSSWSKKARSLMKSVTRRTLGEAKKENSIEMAGKGKSGGLDSFR